MQTRTDPNVNAGVDEAKRIPGTLYVRYSSDEQGFGDSSRRQLSGGQEYGKAHGIQIEKTIVDAGVSGYRGVNLKRGNLGKWLVSVKAGRVAPNSVLLVESIDRLSRDVPTVQFTVLVQILSAGIDIVTFGDGKRYSFDTINKHPHDLFGALGIMVRANDEANTRSLRGKQNWIQKRRRALQEKLTAQGPAWVRLKANRKGWNLVPERVKLVRRMFAMAECGMGKWRIARKLNNEKIVPWGRAKWWTSGYIGRILRNRAVLGEYQPCVREGKRQSPEGSPVAGYYPSIISLTLFTQVNKIRAARKKNQRAVPTDQSAANLFRGLAFDGRTGAAMHHCRVANNPRYSYLYCSAIERGEPSNRWNYTMFEENLLYHLDRVNWRDLAVEPLGGTDVKEKQRLQEGIAKAEDKLKKLLIAVTGDSDPPKTLVKEMKALEAQKATLDRRLADLTKGTKDINERQKLMEEAKLEIEALLRGENGRARERLREEILALVKRIDLWDSARTCRDMIHLGLAINDAIANAGRTLKFDIALCRCYRITFANDAVRWVLCGRTRLQRKGARHPLDPGQHSMILATWDQQRQELA